MIFFLLNFKNYFLSSILKSYTKKLFVLNKIFFLNFYFFNKFFWWCFLETKGKSYRYYLFKNRIRFKLGLTHKFIFYVNTFLKHTRKYRIMLFISSNFFKKFFLFFLFFKKPNTYSENGLKHLFLKKTYKTGKISMK